MKLYKKYIFLTLAKPLLISTFVITGVIWLTRVIRFLKYITEDGIKFSVFLKLALYTLPALLIITIPLSVFITVLIVYNRLIGDNEITILQGTGVKKISLISPALTIALCTTIFCYFLTLILMPMANKGIKNIKEDIKNNYSSIIINENVFNKLRNITIYAENKDKDNNFYGILIYDNRVFSSYVYSKNKNKKHTLIYAKKGNVQNRRGQSILELEEGNIQRFHNVNDQVPEILYFDKYFINLNEYNTEKIRIAPKIPEMYIHELIYAYRNKTLKTSPQSLFAEINYRLTFPLFSIILTFIAGSFILYGSFHRTGKYKNIFYASIVVAGLFLLSIYLYKLAENIFVANYLLYLVMVLAVAASFILIRDLKYNEIRS